MQEPNEVHGSFFDAMEALYADVSRHQTLAVLARWPVSHEDEPR